MDRPSYGRAYLWVPALVECECDQVMDADAHHTTCPNCGGEHSDVMKEVVGRHLSDEVLHPWRPDYEDWRKFNENRVQEWLELQSLDQQLTWRLGSVERALEKMEEGTYGFCDATGSVSQRAGSRQCPRRSTLWRRRWPSRRNQRSTT